MTADPYRRIARAHLHERALPIPHAPSRTLGRIALLPHQQAAIAPLLHRLRRHRGALLADAPGLGKTFVALAIADALHAARPLVIAPAILRTRWLDAARDTGQRIRFRSVESLGRDDRRPRTPLDDAAPSFVIVDEAHHLRTVSTRRWQTAAALVADARVLLLSATPIHNRAADVAAIAALFHVAPGSRDLVRLLRRITVRRPLDELAAADPDGARALRIPAIAPERTLAIPPRDTATLDGIHHLPPLPRDDGPAGDARTRLALVHAWASSTAALAAMLRRRIARCVAIEAACDEGIVPTPAVTRAWQADADGTGVQLALAALLAPSSPPRDDPPPHTLAAERDATARHRLALEALLRDTGPRDDDARARTLARLARWTAAPVVAFTRSRTTARALWRRLRHVAGTALLTGDEAEIASGPVPREELLAMLRDGAGAVGARAHADAPAPRAIRLLVATDVAAEGISLAGARTIVHLDRPWTPARLEQRIGRAARIGAPVDRVAVVAIAPPAGAGDVERVRRILAAKAGIVAHGQRALHAGTPDDAVAIAALARAWLDDAASADVAPPPGRPPPVRPGGDWLVALRLGRRAIVRVVTADGRVVRATAAHWRSAAAARGACGSRPDPPRDPDATAPPAHVVAAVAAWWRARCDPLDRAARRRAPAARATDARPPAPADSAGLARVRRAIDAALADTAPLERTECARGAATVRRRLRAGVGARLLARWIDASADPARCRRWLRELARAQPGRPTSVDLETPSPPAPRRRERPAMPGVLAAVRLAAGPGGRRC